MSAQPGALDAALSREAIRLLITGYCRGVDRADEALLAAQFWPEAEVISGVVNGPAPDFARQIVAYVLASLEACFHSIGNEWIEVRGDHAVGEHYVVAHSRTKDTETLTGGRYIDSYERRGGVWKIGSRTFVCDWQSSSPLSHEAAGFYEGLTTRGCYGSNDPVYRHWERT